MRLASAEAHYPLWQYCIVLVHYYVAVLQFRSGSPSAFAAILPQLRLADVASRIEPDSPDHDKRTFECPKCENVVSEIR